MTEEQVPKKVKDLFNKGFGALERNNLDFAIDMFFHCVELAPDFLKARKYLRAAEVKRFKQKKGGFFGGVKSKIGAAPAFAKTMALVKAGKGDQALLAAEEMLKTDPLTPKFVRGFAEAALLAEQPEAAVLTLETCREHHSEDADVMEMLGDAYMKVDNTTGARECYEILNKLRPNNPDSIRKLKNCLAAHSLNKDGWEQTADGGGTFQELVKDKEEAKVLEKQSKAVTSASDADALIADARAKSDAEPENISYRRQLGRLYAQKKDFEQAIAELEKAHEISHGDPEVEKAITGVKVQQFDHNIATLTESGKMEEAQAVELEKAQFVFDDLQERVQRYPNDLRLRYDLGVMLFENDYINEAIQQFQLSQRSPNHRIKSLYYLAMCFKQKKQYDMAVMQLETADKELPIMNDDKKSVCYELGELAMAMGDRPKAAEYYKEVYQSDIGYRDIAEKIEQVYEDQ